MATDVPVNAVKLSLEVPCFHLGAGRDNPFCRLVTIGQPRVLCPTVYGLQAKPGTKT